MDKILDTINEVQAYTNAITGLQLAMTVCRRRMLEARTQGEIDILHSAMEDIYNIMLYAKGQIPVSLQNSALDFSNN